MARKPVNARQLDVLGWVAGGCPEGVMTDFSYKTTAVALRNRRLLKVSRRGGWHVELTEDGRYYLEHGAYPDEPPRPARPPRVRSVAKPRPPKPDSLTRVDRPDVQKGSVPAASPPAPAKPKIAVPASLRKPHPVVAELRDSKRDLDLTASVRSRAFRVLHALAHAAEQRGYQVEPAKRQHDSYGRSWYGSDHLVINTGEVRAAVRIVQLTDRTPHVLTAKEVREAGDRWAPTPPKYDHTPNAYLRVELDRSWRGSRYSWSEGPRGPIDRKLPAVLEEIEQRHERAKERRLEQAAREAERVRQHERALERAKMMLQQEHRAKALVDQINRSTQATQIREYVETMKAVAEALDDEAKAGADEWIAWVAGYAEAIDPLKQELRMPEDPEPTDEALALYLPRRGYSWSR